MSYYDYFGRRMDYQSSYEREMYERQRRMEYERMRYGNSLQSYTDNKGGVYTATPIPEPTSKENKLLLLL